MYQPEAETLKNAMSRQNDKNKFYVVGSARNIYTYQGLLDFKKVNYIDFGLAINEELGHMYKKHFYHNFVFIGKDSKITGLLNDDTTVEELDLMFKRALASFYDLTLKKEKDIFLLTKSEFKINLEQFFNTKRSDIELKVINSTNPDAVDYEITGNDLILDPGIIEGFSTLTVRAKIPGEEIYVQSRILIINPSELYEDFERDELAGSEFDWINQESAPWTVTDKESYFNSRSLRSGEIAPGQKSALSLELDLEKSGIVMFAYKTSTRDYYNKLNFYIDDLNMNSSESPYMWSGENEWRIVSYTLRGGKRTLKWEYEKSPYDPLYNQDRVWIDLITIPDKFNTTSVNRNDFTRSYSAYPNPFNPVTNIKFRLDKQYKTELVIFDAKGRLVEYIERDILSKGEHSYKFKADNLPSGIYYSVLKFGNTSLTKRIILTK
ncbi:MAG: T9SS type A sorting domain-containing protein [Candidatus Delongbacteria bacterium]